MWKKFFVGLIASLAVFIMPVCLVRPDAIGYLKPWVMVGIGLFASLTQPAYSPIDRNAPTEDKGTANQLVWTVYTVLVLGVFESLVFHYPEGMLWNYFSGVMLGLSVVGAVIRAWAVVELGLYFSWHVRIQPDQSVISSGPYQLVRHPGYSGAWVLYVSCLLLQQAWISAFLCGVFLLVGFLRRIRYEEKLLLEHFGEEYRDYSQGVKKLIPLIW